MGPFSSPALTVGSQNSTERCGAVGELVGPLYRLGLEGSEVLVGPMVGWCSAFGSERKV